MASPSSSQLALPLGPSRGLQKTRSVKASVYEGGAQTSRTVRWKAPTLGANAATLNDLTTLRDRSRRAVRNDGYAKGTIDKLVSNVVGTGIKPLSRSVDPEFRKAVHALWLRWTDHSDADGVLDYYGQQRQAARAWFEAGEVFIRLRPRLPEDNLSVPLQLQVIEPELCPHLYNGINPDTGFKIRAGIEFNPIGGREAYWFYTQRPGDTADWDPSYRVRVPASFVCHIFDPLRPGQVRGVPHLAQALIRLHELSKFEDAVLLRSQIANLFAGFVTRTGPVDNPGLDPLTAAPLDYGPEGRPLIPLDPGIFQALDPGEDVKFNAPPTADPFGPAFMKQQLMGVASATGVPYEVISGDMAGLNDRVMRVVLHEFRRMCQGAQNHIIGYQLCRPVWNAWLDRAYLAGALPIPSAYLRDPSPWQAVDWKPQGWPYIHPVQDVTAAENAIKAGLTSRSAVVAEAGEDAEVIDAEQAEDNRRASELGLSYESGTAASVAAPAPIPAGA